MHDQGGPIVRDAFPLNEIVLWFPAVVVIGIIFPLDKVFPCPFRCTTSIENFLDFVREERVWVFVYKFELRGGIFATKQRASAIFEDVHVLHATKVAACL